jgi:hypothetical protein
MVVDQVLLDAGPNTQRCLRREWEELLGQIRGIAGFEGFLQAVSFDAPQTSAAEGPVVIVSTNKHCSNAFILLDAGPPLLVSLGDIYEDICRISSQFSTARSSRSSHSERFTPLLRFVLMQLCKLLVCPLVEDDKST